MVDAEYALRTARFGYDVILACGAQISHRIGAPTPHSLMGRDVSTSNHPAWRRYYMARNRIPVWRANARRAPAWVAFDYMGHIRDTLLMALYESNSAAKLNATVRGTLDGLRGVTGATKGPDDF
jgi:rhamnosyltransferase